jgi:hypothetical protein
MTVSKCYVHVALVLIRADAAAQANQAATSGGMILATNIVQLLWEGRGELG